MKEEKGRNVRRKKEKRKEENKEGRNEGWKVRRTEEKK
jgi:hypothetical protein